MTRSKASLKIKYALIGHAERRALGEDNDGVKRRLARALHYKLRPIICIGERTRDVDGGYLSELRDQVLSSLSGLSYETMELLTYAYEPVWAIGAQKAMTPHEIFETVLYIRKCIAEKFPQELAHRIPILYGGSVTKENILGIKKGAPVDGFLLGRSSLDLASFGDMLQILKTL
jgi:triosephosphate isomerase (TIM)